VAKRHMLMLAHTYVHGAPIGGWYASEKLDGMRAFWDGGITRGKPCSEIPFANTAKDARLVIKPKATGLWSRYGKVIHAPNWWLDSLPQIPLDGELYGGRNGFQGLMSTVKDHTPGAGWTRVEYRVFDAPPPHVVFSDGEINETNFKRKFVHLAAKLPKIEYPLPGVPQFRTVLKWLCGNPISNDVVKIHHQIELPFATTEAVKKLNVMLDTITSAGGEGVMLRSPTSIWVPQRTRTLLKCKALNDAEGVVTGYTFGRETDLGSKLLGLMGALVLDFRGKRFELSGFTDAERVLATLGMNPVDSAFEYGCKHPGEAVPEIFYNPMFPRGSVVTFRYRELTDDLLPKEARYWRKRDE
jgi:DNA ligase-1